MIDEPEDPFRDATVESLKASAAAGGMSVMDMIDEELRDALVEFVVPMRRFVAVVCKKTGRNQALTYCIGTVVRAVLEAYEK